MISPEGQWIITDPQGTNPKSMSFEIDGEAWSVICERGNGQADFLGVGFTHNGSIFVARGLVRQDAELGEKVGLVRYDMSSLGELPARWYHCSLGGRISEGLSSAGPSDSIFGEYRADYASGDGTAFNPLRKTIVEQSNGLQFTWWDDEKFHYMGVGCMVADDLLAAWGPPGALVQFVHYKPAPSGQMLHGRWYDLGRNLSGTEVLARP